ncbi:MAG: ATP-binding protein [Chitinophagales bacterium]|nr:ATP-binding protein [Chitinophagales bacterium]
MIFRNISPAILKSAAHFPAIGIIGPRQVGKTTLARQLRQSLQKESIYLDLELDEDIARLQNPQAYLQAHQDKCIILDEVQLMPRLFPLLRALIDQQRSPARFLLLGSASPTIIRQSSETLAGRIAYHELTPLSLPEAQSAGISQEKHWFTGGFPDALLQPDPEVARTWLRFFVNTFLEKDIKAMGYEVSLQTISKLYRMVAHIHGQLQNASSLSQALGVSPPTVSKYLDLMEGGFMLSRLTPYYVNLGKRLVKSPKLYLRDTGILHYLAAIPNFDALQGNQLIGASWEGYVIEQIRRCTDDAWQFYFYRTVAGAETDLVLISPNGKMTCVEVKYATIPQLSKGFYQSIEDLKPDFQYVIVPQASPYQLRERLKVVSLSDFLNNELKTIA